MRPAPWHVSQSTESAPFSTSGAWQTVHRASFRFAGGKASRARAWALSLHASYAAGWHTLHASAPMWSAAAVTAGNRARRERRERLTAAAV